ncbi:MAG TPA: MATE family efflux transporter [Sphingomonadales bacterium]|nr:MATE family efflux transporter [Sphingomonadales bacterium]
MTATVHDRAWLKERLRRHLHELLRLAWPVMLSRLGIVTLGLADTIMVGFFSTRELAYLNLGSTTLIMVFLVAVVGLLLGTLIETADAYGAEDFKKCGRILRRSLPYAALLGLIAMVASLPAESWFLFTGQTAGLAAEGGQVMRILAFGLIGHLLFVNVGFFLEGIARPKPVMAIMLAGNLLNILFNYMLIYGHFGFPALGAVGSAWATTALRLAMAAMALGFVIFAPSMKPFAVFRQPVEHWQVWASQRERGYGAGLSLGVEVVAFAALGLFAGWLGTLPLAAWGVVFNVMTIPFMLAAGIGTATAVRVGIANAMRDPRDTALAGWTGYGFATLILIACVVPIFVLARPIFTLYTADAALIVFGAPLVAYSAYVIVADGGQTVLANALRGIGEIWVPTGIQTLVYIVIMIPLCWALAFPLQRGVSGLLEGILIASVVSIALQGWRFYWRTRGAYPLVERKAA